ncbi:MAG: hypothetical protein HY897_03565 [Deltaproteobacteria bacterium]|nr:hypothetical protein [Deltaproteobacteria bacterium]
MKAIHANCPNCGASLMLEPDSRITTCGFCNARLLVEIENFAPLRWFAPAVSREDATLAIRRVLKDPLMPADVTKLAALDSVTLAFVPFHLFRARRVGVMTTVETKGADSPVRAADTRVLFNPVSACSIATDVSGWGLDRLDLEKVVEDPRFPARPYRAAELQKMGEVFAPTRPSERFVADRTRTFETRDTTITARLLPDEVSVWYYPVWLVRYTYRGSVFRASVDALNGEVLFVRAPQSNRHRLPPMLAILALLSMPAASLVRYVLESERPMESATAVSYVVIVTWPLVFGILSMFLLVVYLTWMNYRYPGEVVVTPGGREIEKLGKPSATWVERLFEKVDLVTQRWLAAMRRKGD